MPLELDRAIELPDGLLLFDHCMICIIGLKLVFYFFILLLYFDGFKLVQLPKTLSLTRLLSYYLLQKFELKQNPFLLQLIGNMPDEELARSTLAAQLNSYSAELCPPKIQKDIDAKINDILRKGWPILRQV